MREYNFTKLEIEISSHFPVNFAQKCAHLTEELSKGPGSTNLVDQARDHHKEADLSNPKVKGARSIT